MRQQKFWRSAQFCISVRCETFQVVDLLFTQVKKGHFLLISWWFQWLQFDFFFFFNLRIKARPWPTKQERAKQQRSGWIDVGKQSMKNVWSMVEKLNGSWKDVLAYWRETQHFSLAASIIWTQRIQKGERVILYPTVASFHWCQVPPGIFYDTLMCIFS